MSIEDSVKERYKDASSARIWTEVITYAALLERQRRDTMCGSSPLYSEPKFPYRIKMDDRGLWVGCVFFTYDQFATLDRARETAGPTHRRAVDAWWIKIVDHVLALAKAVGHIKERCDTCGQELP